MNKNLFIVGGAVASLCSCGATDSTSTAEKQPNVIVILTDDQGIANLSCLGNEYISTPAIDKLYGESVRMTDFHVSPLSTPTRSAIISGRYPIRNGAWATFKGRDMLSHSQQTIAEIFHEGGYTTALFGKWHLGDNYPSRATDCGFDHVVQHSSGGVGELSDYWGNSYFDDTYLVNNVPTEFKGYCTDVWFSQAEKFITEKAKGDKPFFVYLATNAPHSPHIAPEKNTQNYMKYQEQGIIKEAAYYGQIENIDENIARFDKFLTDSGLAENTILIFTTDNGAPPANNPHTMGYRGGKSSPLEGGHRVPFFIRWPKGGVQGGVDVGGLGSHVDIIPTLASMCNVEISKEVDLDGIDISNAILRTGSIPEDRIAFIHHRQTYEPPFDVDKSVVMQGKWRLISGKQLFDVVADRPQKVNLAKKHPEVVEALLKANSEFIAKTKSLDAYQNLVPSVVDKRHQDVTTLTIQHAMGSAPGLWMPVQICSATHNENSRYLIELPKDARVKISLSRWARECQGTIWGVPAQNPKGMFEYKAITPEVATLKIGDAAAVEKRITAEMKEVDFIQNLPAGRHIIDATFTDDGVKFGAYYIYVEELE